MLNGEVDYTYIPDFKLNIVERLKEKKVYVITATDLEILLFHNKIFF